MLEDDDILPFGEINTGNDMIDLAWERSFYESLQEILESNLPTWFIVLFLASVLLRIVVKQNDIIKMNIPSIFFMLTSPIIFLIAITHLTYKRHQYYENFDATMSEKKKTLPYYVEALKMIHSKKLQLNNYLPGKIETKLDLEDANNHLKLSIELNSLKYILYYDYIKEDMINFHIREQLAVEKRNYDKNLKEAFPEDSIYYNMLDLHFALDSMSQIDYELLDSQPKEDHMLNKLMLAIAYNKHAKILGLRKYTDGPVDFSEDLDFSDEDEFVLPPQMTTNPPPE